MIFVHITPACDNAERVLVAAPNMEHLYTVMRDIPFSHIEEHKVAKHPGTEGVRFHLPEDDRRLIAFMLNASDKGALRGYALAGAYARRYVDPVAAKHDWDAGLDFRIVKGPDAGRYCSKRDARHLVADGFTHVSIRLEIPPYVTCISLEDAQ